jgi:hypothetical protein
MGVEPVKKLLVPIDAPGLYYLRIQAPKAHDGGTYSIIARWGDLPTAAPAPAPVESEPAAPRPQHAHREPRPRHTAGDAVQARIVSAYREGGKLVLQLDKGAAARVAVGQTGTVLDGPSGETPLDGGAFTITQVIDDGRSIARAQLHSVGRNTRVVINVR